MLLKDKQTIFHILTSGLKKIFFSLLCLIVILLKFSYATDELSDRTALLAPKLNIQSPMDSLSELELDSCIVTVDLVESLPYLANETWLKIFEEAISSSSCVNYMEKASRIASVSRMAYTLLYQLPNLQLIQQLNFLAFDCRNFLGEYNAQVDPKVEWINEISKLNSRHRGLGAKIQARLSNKETKESDIFILNRIGKENNGLLQILNPININMLNYTQDNPDCLRDRSVVSALRTYAQDSQQTLPSYKFRWVREYKRIFSNPKVAALLPVCLTGMAIWTGIQLYNAYPNISYPTETELDAAYYAFLNQTQIPADSSMSCFDYYCGSQEVGWSWRSQMTAWATGKIKTPRFCLWPDEPCTGWAFFSPFRGNNNYIGGWNSGDRSEWIRFIANRCSGNFTQMFNQISPLYNTSVSRADSYTCSLSPDRTSLTCYNAYTTGCPVDTGLCLEVTKGSGECAKQQLINDWQQTIDNWAYKRTIYYGFNVGLSSVFSILWILNFIYCVYYL